MTDSRTIYLHGINFDVAEADGEILDAEVEDADEFLEYHGDDFGECRLDEGYSADAMAEWALEHMRKQVWAKIDWRLMPLHEQYGVRAYGPLE